MRTTLLNLTGFKPSFAQLIKISQTLLALEAVGTTFTRMVALCWVMINQVLLVRSFMAQVRVSPRLCEMVVGGIFPDVPSIFQGLMMWDTLTKECHSSVI